QPEVGAEVDDDRGEGAQAVDLAHGFAVTQRGEDDVGLAQLAARGEDEIRAAAKRRMHEVDALAGEPLRRRLRPLDRGVTAQDSQQRAPGVAGGAGDGSPHQDALSAVSSTRTPRSNSSRSMCSSGVWSRCESPGPYASAGHPHAGARWLRSEVPV